VDLEKIILSRSSAKEMGERYELIHLKRDCAQLHEKKMCSGK